jgi:hypothetical protein
MLSVLFVENWSMKTLLPMKRRGISYSSAQNGVEKSIGGEVRPHAPKVFEVDYYTLEVWLRLQF